MGTLGKLAVALGAVLTAAGGFIGYWFGWHEPGPDRPDPFALGPGRYVALGDSYSAGEGLRPFLDGTQDVADGGDRCHRSEQGYPALLVIEPEREVEFRACSGADIVHLYDELQEHGGTAASSGIQALDQLGDDVALITLTISGNDVGFADIVKFCAISIDCVDDADWPYGGATLREWADELTEPIRNQLDVVYRRLRTEAPNARIVVVGYPHLFSDDTTTRGQKQCLGYKLLFGDGERADITELGHRLNAAIATTAVSAGLEYVHVADVFHGHETCGEEGQWLKWVEDGLFFDGLFHPNRVGQRVIARTIACYLGAYPKNPYTAIDASTASLTAPATTAHDAIGRFGVAVGFADDETHACALG